MIDIEIFRNREPGPIGVFRKSAVMLLIQETAEGPVLVLEKRALTMRSQPGDISLPGGRIDPGETNKEAAIRETCEELGILEKDLEVIGPMDFFVTHFGAIIYPFVSRTKVTQFRPNPPEVDELLFVPLEDLLQQVPDVFILKVKPQLDDTFPYHRIHGGRDYKFSEPEVEEYFYHFNGHHIWGTTARIIHEFLMILRQQDHEIKDESWK